MPSAGSEEEDFVVEAVLGKKTVKGKPQFLLKWRGYPASEATWCARRTFRCTAAVQRRHPAQLRSRRREPEEN